MYPCGRKCLRNVHDPSPFPFILLAMLYYHFIQNLSINIMYKDSFIFYIFYDLRDSAH